MAGPERVHRQVTAEEALRREAEAALDETPQARADAQREADEYFERRAAVAALKAERQRQGLTVDEAARRMGMPPLNLVSIENDRTADPTLATIQRYAAALGKKMVFTLAEA